MALPKKVQKLIEASGIKNAGCMECASCLYGENRRWECSKIDPFNNLKSFPFKKTMPCWTPDPYCSKFFERVDLTEPEDYDKAMGLFCTAIDPILGRYK